MPRFDLHHRTFSCGFAFAFSSQNSERQEEEEEELSPKHIQSPKTLIAWNNRNVALYSYSIELSQKRSRSQKVAHNASHRITKRSTKQNIESIMVHFRLTRAQRAAAHSTAIASHTSRNRDIATAASTAASTRPADEAPYYQIESSINQFAGNTASSSGSPAFGVEVEAVDTGIGNTDSGNLDSSVEENIASTFGNISAVASASSHQNDIASVGTTPDSRSTRAKKSVGDDSNSSSSSAKRRVLRLLDSPRRKILGRMSGNSAATSSGSSTVGAQGSGLTLSAGIAAASPAPSQSSPSTPRVDAGRSRLLQVMPQPIATSNGEMSGKSDDDNEDNEPPSPLSSSSHTIYPVQETSSSLLTSSPILTLKKSSKPNGLPPPTTVQSKFADPSNILEWLHDEAPDDILPRVLSFAGSRRIAALSLASKSWRRMCLSETVWQTACEDTGKYRPGIDPPLQPTVTWLQHYRDNPLVPVDYDTIQRAMYKADVCAMDAEDGSNRHPTVPQHQRSLLVLLKPKTYVLKEALVVHALGRAEVTIETVDGPSEQMVLRKRTLESSELGGRIIGGGLDSDVAAEAIGAAGRLDRSASATSSGSAKRRLRDLLSCRSTSGVGSIGHGSDLDTIGAFDPSSTSDDLSNSSSSALYYHHYHAVRSRTESLPNLPQDPAFYHDGSCPKYAKRRAVLVLKTKKANEPIARVRQGTLRLKHVDCVHNANGTDIWNGNAAVQVQPPLDEAGEFTVETAPPNRTATAYIDSCDITSLSGRGLVTIDGGRATVTNSHVHHCAATGIYIGGPSSRAIIRGTDVVQNGYGNKRNTRRGITRGHSGVYLEQGTANLRDCNVSNNALTGISAVSADNALLDVRDTDLMSNETMQLEMPPAGSRSYRRSISRDNRIVQEGTSRSRSGLVPPEDAVVSSPNTLYNGIVGEGNSSSMRRRRREHEGLPQSPASDGDDGEQQQQVGSPH